MNDSFFVFRTFMNLHNLPTGSVRVRTYVTSDKCVVMRMQRWPQPSSGQDDGLKPQIPPRRTIYFENRRYFESEGNFAFDGTMPEISVRLRLRLHLLTAHTSTTRCGRKIIGRRNLFIPVITLANLDPKTAKHTRNQNG